MLFGYIKMSCQICQEVQSKYKCPKCYIAYCSVSCWKTHQETNCETVINSKDIEQSASSKKSSDFITNSTVLSEVLNRLEHSSDIRNILRNHHVRDMLLRIDRSGNPAEIMNESMQEPIFVEFVDECLKVIEEQNEP